MAWCTKTLSTLSTAPIELMQVSLIQGNTPNGMDPDQKAKQHCHNNSNTCNISVHSWSNNDTLPDYCGGIICAHMNSQGETKQNYLTLQAGH